VQQNQIDLPPYFILLCAVGLWLLICPLSSFMSGWMQLSRRFRAVEKPVGQVRTAGPIFYSTYWRLSSHDPFVRLTSADDALHLSIIFALRPFHPPLRIPWDEVRFEWTGLFVGRWVCLTLGSKEQIPLYFSERTARRLGILDRLPEANHPLFPNFDTLSESVVESLKKKSD